jgi:hypothetical protein
MRTAFKYNVENTEKLFTYTSSCKLTPGHFMKESSFWVDAVNHVVLDTVYAIYIVQGNIIKILRCHR